VVIDERHDGHALRQQLGRLGVIRDLARSLTPGAARESPLGADRNVDGPVVRGRQLAGAAEGAAGRLAEVGDGRPLDDLDFPLVVNAELEGDLAVAALEPHDLVRLHGGLRERPTSSSAQQRAALSQSGDRLTAPARERARIA
jgi:hypothetical protein